MKVIPIYIEAGVSGFKSPAAEYKELGLSVKHQGCQCKVLVSLMVIY